MYCTKKLYQNFTLYSSASIILFCKYFSASHAILKPLFFFIKKIYYLDFWYCVLVNSFIDVCIMSKISFVMSCVPLQNAKVELPFNKILDILFVNVLKFINKLKTSSFLVEIHIVVTCLGFDVVKILRK